MPDKATPPKAIWHSANKCIEFIKKNLMPEGEQDRRDGFLDFADKEQERARR